MTRPAAHRGTPTPARGSGRGEIPYCPRGPNRYNECRRPAPRGPPAPDSPARSSTIFPLYDWRSPPADYAEWLHRVKATLITCGKSTPTGANLRHLDIRALYAAGATHAQAAVACAHYDRWLAPDGSPAPDAPHYIRPEGWVNA